MSGSVPPDVRRVRACVRACVCFQNWDFVKIFLIYVGHSTCHRLLFCFWSSYWLSAVGRGGKEPRRRDKYPGKWRYNSGDIVGTGIAKRCEGWDGKCGVALPLTLVDWLPVYIRCNCVCRLEPWSCDSGCHWGAQTSVRHLGWHGECRKPHGYQRIAGSHTGSSTAVHGLLCALLMCSGADSIRGTGVRAPPLLQMAGHGGTVSRRRANKKLTKLYWPSRKRLPKRLIVLLEPKSGGARPKFFPALCRVGR